MSVKGCVFRFVASCASCSSRVLLSLLDGTGYTEGPFLVRPSQTDRLQREVGHAFALSRSFKYDSDRCWILCSDCYSLVVRDRVGARLLNARLSKGLSPRSIPQLTGRKRRRVCSHRLLESAPPRKRPRLSSTSSSRLHLPTHAPSDGETAASGPTTRGRAQRLRRRESQRMAKRLQQKKPKKKKKKKGRMRSETDLGQLLVNSAPPNVISLPMNVTETSKVLLSLMGNQPGMGKRKLFPFPSSSGIVPPVPGPVTVPPPPLPVGEVIEI